MKSARRSAITAAVRWGWCRKRDYARLAAHEAAGSTVYRAGRGGVATRRGLQFLQSVAGRDAGDAFQSRRRQRRLPALDGTAPLAHPQRNADRGERRGWKRRQGDGAAVEGEA